MGATGIPGLSQHGDGEPRARGPVALAHRIRAMRALINRPSPLLVGAVVVCVAVAFVAALTYYGAREFTSRAADQRASEEAMSFAKHSSLLATGDAFNGYLQILRYSEDPTVRSRDIDDAARRDAMQQLLWLNTNKMYALAVADRSGLVLASTDRSIVNVRTSTAFNASRANLGPSNSDIIMPDEGKPGYVEFAAPLRDDTGAVWGFLYARARPQMLWRDTLNASIDGGHNVIINSQGLFSAGVPDVLLAQPWTGAPLENGGVRAEIAGVDSICGLGAIGKDTQIDHGWSVASCLPATLIQAEAGRALGRQGQVTIAGAVLAIVVSIGLLKLAFREPPAPAEADASEEAAHDEVPDDALELPIILSVVEQVELEVAAPETPPEEAEPPAPPAVAPPPVIVVADVDALSLIEAYERRNALLSDELRETIQARLMIAATQAEEAYRLVETDPERARALHRTAIDEIESLRERELRGMGQELHPSLVRLGLRGALRALQKEFEGRIRIELAIDANVDGASSRGGRITIDPRLRLVVYRLIRDAVRALIDQGVEAVSIALERDSLELTVAVSSETSEATFALPDTLVADEVALQAFGGSMSVDTGERLRITATVIAPHVEQPEAELTASDAAIDAAVDDGSSAHESVVVESAEDANETVAASLGDALRALKGSAAINVRMDIEPALAERGVTAELQNALLTVVREAIDGFAEARTSECSVELVAEGGGASLRISGSAHLDVPRLDAIRRAGEQANCSVSITSDEGGVSIALGFEFGERAAPPPANVSTFTLPEREPEIVDVGAEQPRTTVLPPLATTFVLPEDEPDIVEATEPRDEPPVEEPDVPKVVQLSSIEEAFEIESAPDTNADTAADAVSPHVDNSHDEDAA